MLITIWDEKCQLVENTTTIVRPLFSNFWLIPGKTNLAPVWSSLNNVPLTWAGSPADTRPTLYDFSLTPSKWLRRGVLKLQRIITTCLDEGDAELI